MAVYHECLRIGQQHPWMGFIDVDEFLIPAPGHVFLPDFLRTFEGHCALVVNWQVLGSNNHTTRPKGGLLENYVDCVPHHYYLNSWTKVIANPKLVRDFLYVGDSGLQGPHKVSCRAGTHMVTETMERVGAPDVYPIQMSQVALYHYATKSREEFAEREVRGSVSGYLRGFSFFDEVNANATEKCFAGRDLARALGDMSAHV